MAALSEDLNALGTHLFTRQNLQMALIGEEDVLPQARSSAAAIFEQLAEGQSDGFGPPQIRMDDETLREGWSTSTAVSFVALVV